MADLSRAICVFAAPPHSGNSPCTSKLPPPFDDAAPPLSPCTRRQAVTTVGALFPSVSPPLRRCFRRLAGRRAPPPSPATGACSFLRRLPGSLPPYRQSSHLLANQSRAHRGLRLGIDHRIDCWMRPHRPVEPIHARLPSKARLRLTDEGSMRFESRGFCHVIDSDQW